MSLEAATDIVTVTPSIDLSDYWSKVARERIRLKQDDIRSPGFFRNSDASNFKCS